MKQQLLSTLGAIVLLDQFTKYLATQAGISHFNQGVSWGLARTESQVILTTAIIFLMVALWLWQKPLWKRYPVVAGLLFGGGISNIIDRILFKGVIDWLPVPGINVSNNIADWSITLALAAILLLEIKAHKANKAEKEDIHGD